MLTSIHILNASFSDVYCAFISNQIRWKLNLICPQPNASKLTFKIKLIISNYTTHLSLSHPYPHITTQLTQEIHQSSVTVPLPSSHCLHKPGNSPRLNNTMNILTVHTQLLNHSAHFRRFNVIHQLFIVRSEGKILQTWLIGDYRNKTSCCNFVNIW
jgi:hypothetical protein